MDASAISNDFSLDPGSFRDPCGFIFYKDNKVFRAIKKESAAGYEMLMKSGLYNELVSQNVLIAHVQADVNEFQSEKFFGHAIISQEKIPFISYFEKDFTIAYTINLPGSERILLQMPPLK